MSLPSLFATTSNADRRKERENAKQKEKVENKYDPRLSSRELNPYWKQGGDGLPSQSKSSKFKKPTEETSYDLKYKHKPTRSNWRKPQETSSKREETLIFRSESPLSDHYEEVPRKISQKPDKIEANTNAETTDFLTDKEMNDIAAKIVKAEILGNTAMIQELKDKLERARAHRKNSSSVVKDNEENVMLMRTDAKGFSRPLNAPETQDNHSKRKKKKLETHDAGNRLKYFADDDKYSLKQMFENEKYNTSEQQDSEFLKLTSKVAKLDDMDDIFMDKIRNEKSSDKEHRRERDRAIREHERMSSSLDNCQQCIQSASMPKHLMVSLGETVYLSLPPHEPLTEGHCLLIPNRHVPCATQLDENEWSELNDFRKSLTNMFLAQDDDVIFYETVLNSHTYSHMVIHCVPVPKEQGDLAPIYFKKAIDECETEWSTNKKLINLAGKDVRRAVPKGLPYFFVSFGMSEGFAHVIEDERDFPRYFAAEVIGGILDLHHSKWRKPRSEKFDVQKARVLQFSNNWKQFDCTNKN